MTCQSNLRQQGLGVMNYESAYKLLPASGEGIDFAALASYKLSPSWSKKYTLPGPISVYTVILPFIEQAALYDQYNTKFLYNDGRAPGNQIAAKTELGIYRCPSSPFGLESKDPNGYGRTDYFATCYTDIGTSVNGSGFYYRDETKGAAGALGLRPAKIGTVADGTSNTILFIEDTGRTHETVLFGTEGGFPDGVADAGGTVPSGDTVQTSIISYNTNPANGVTLSTLELYVNGTWVDQEGKRRSTVHRWADPDAAGSGVSGARNINGQYINNNRTPYGGNTNPDPALTFDATGQFCPWTENTAVSTTSRTRSTLEVQVPFSETVQFVTCLKIPMDFSFDVL